MKSTPKWYWRVTVPTAVVVLLVMAGLSGWGWTHTPADARLPIHWDMRGAVDGYGGKFGAFLLLPLIVLGLVVLMAVLPLIDPRRPNVERSLKAYTSIWIAILCVMTGVHFAIVLSALGRPVDVSSFVMFLIAVMLVVAGNYLGKLRSNFFVGIRTPWTLSSELSWSKTHRLAGWLFVVVGLAVLATVMLSSVLVATVTLAIGSLGAVLIVVVYSYVVWRRDPTRQHTTN